MSNALNTAVTLQHILLKQWPVMFHDSIALEPRELAWQKELEEIGFVIVPDFLSRDECARLREEFHRLEQEYAAYVQTRSDRRIFGANRVSLPIREFAEHPSLVALARANYCSPEVSCLTLSQLLEYTPGNLGSGEGWHRDSYSPQFKSIVYLTDVEEDNGPFQIVPRSHRPFNMVADTIALGVESGRKRFTPEEIDEIVERRYPEGIRTVVGTAGTVILAVTSALHRGKPIETGNRYALTNYFFKQPIVPSWGEKHFGAVPPELAIP